IAHDVTTGSKSFSFSCTPRLRNDRSRLVAEGFTPHVIRAARSWFSSSGVRLPLSLLRSPRRGKLGAVASFQDLRLPAEHHEVLWVDRTCNLVDGPRQVRPRAARDDLLHTGIGVQLDTEVEVLDPHENE